MLGFGRSWALTVSVIWALGMLDFVIRTAMAFVTLEADGMFFFFVKTIWDRRTKHEAITLSRRGWWHSGMVRGTNANIYFLCCRRTLGPLPDGSASIVVRGACFTWVKRLLYPKSCCQIITRSDTSHCNIQLLFQVNCCFSMLFNDSCYKASLRMFDHCGSRQRLSVHTLTRDH